MSSNEPDAFDTFMSDFAGSDVKVEADPSPEPDELANVDVDTDEEDSSDSAADGKAAVEKEHEDDDGEAEPEEGEDADDTVEVEEDEPKVKGKKSAQERIAEVVAKQRKAERERDAERAEKEEFRRRLEQLEKPAAKEAPNKQADINPNEFGLVEPSENDLDADGEPKYPLGAFDPNFMRDINRFDRAVEKAYEAKVNEQYAQLAAQQAEEQKLIENWNTRLDEVEKASPKIREKAQILVDALDDSDPRHMQALAQTLMTLENGPAVMEYLADNLDEADKISRLPIERALLQLGRLDGMFYEDDGKEEPVRIKTTSAPKPPSKLARGSGTSGRSGGSLYDKMLKDFR